MSIFQVGFFILNVTETKHQRLVCKSINHYQNSMNSTFFFKFRIYFTTLITIVIGLLLLWNHSHGGVPSHHILQRKDLPEISNWWGLILLPTLTWFLSYRIQKRIINGPNTKRTINALYGFLGALTFGILLAAFFTFGNTEMPFYMLMGLLILALFLPIYRSECLLGFVIGMTFTFGVVVPTGIGTIFIILTAIIHLGIRPAALFVVKKCTDLVNLKNTTSNK